MKTEKEIKENLEMYKEFKEQGAFSEHIDSIIAILEWVLKPEEDN